MAIAPVLAQDATSLLAKAIVAFDSNQKSEKHWNWSIVETRRLETGKGETLEKFPAVSSESVIRSDGRRCNAVTKWSDGLVPYLKDADPELRCQAYNALNTPFQVVQLLRSTQIRVISQSASAIRLEILPDSSKAKSQDYLVRCAAALRAFVDLDPATFFPMRIEGEVAGTGCNSTFEAVDYYGRATREPMVNQFRKGATFRLVYALQSDKFGNLANSFWISTEQRYVQPWDPDARLINYWGRQVRVKSTAGRRLVKEVATTAQEFGAGSLLRFDKEPGQDQ
ncbi:MAG: hypothetical protein ABI759_17760 [Candidatus Solibacter sp.]